VSNTIRSYTRTSAADVRVLAAAAGIVALHVLVGLLDEHRLVWRPVGHGTVFILYWCLLTVVLSANLLLAKGGRSWAAAIALGITLIEVILLFTA
jgi:hypothetical protein